MTSINNKQKVLLTAHFNDASDKPARVDGVPTWNTSDETIVTLEPAADGLTAYAVAVGPEGAATITVTADADLDPGDTEVRELSATYDIEVGVAEEEAATAIITAGAPEPK